MKNNTLRKTINVDKPNLMTLWTLKQEDNVVLKLSLFKEATPFTITGQTIRLGAKTQKGLKEQLDGFTIQENNLDIDLKNTILVPGLIEIDLEFTDAEGKMTSTSFFINVDSKVLNDAAVEATNEFSTFKRTVEEIQEDYQGLRKIVIDENNAANLQDQVNKVNSSLEHKATKQEVDIERKRIDGFIALPSGTSQLDAEVIDSRLGADGKTYNSLGTAIRGQFKANNENINSIVNGGVYDITTNFTDGGYVNNVQKKITPMGNYSYSDIITLLKGETIKVIDGKCDTITVVDMLSKWSSDGTKYISSIYAYSVKNSGETYSYTATEDIEYIRVCYTTSLGKPTVKRTLFSLSRCRENINDLKKYNTKMSEYIPQPLETQANIVEINGKYCNAVTNKLTTHSGYFYTDLYQLKKGEKITVTSKDASSTNVARISKWTSDGNTMLNIIERGTTNITTVSYVATDDIEFLRFSGQIDVQFDVIKTSITFSKSLEFALKNLIKDNNNEYLYPSLSMFETIGFCGDSYVKGQIYNSSGLVGDKPNLSWGSNIGRLNGITPYIYASSGADTNTWQTRWDCLPKVLSEPARGLYIFCMGINDYVYVTKGTIEDITSHSTYTEYPNTFYGNYGKIIEQIKEHAPNSKIILMPPFYVSTSKYYKYAIEALKEITEYYSIPLIDTEKSKLAQSDFFMNGMVGGHPTAPLHSAMAKDITNLINECIKENYDYFKDYVGI